MSCSSTHKLIIRRLNGVVTSRSWIRLEDGLVETDQLVLGRLEAAVDDDAGCDEAAEVTVDLALVLPKICATVDGGPPDFVTPVSTDGVITYYNELGELITGTVALNDDPCACECAGGGIAGPGPQANNDVILDPVISGTSEFINVATNDLPCPDNQSTTYELVAGSEDNVSVVDIVPLGNGVFEFTPIDDGSWSFDYEIFCDGIPTGEIATVSGTAETPIEILSCFVPFDVQCINPPTFSINTTISNNGTVAAFSVTRDFDNVDFVVRLTEVQGSVTFSIAQGNIRVRLDSPAPDALVLWEWFQADGVTPVTPGFTAGFEVGDLDGPSSNEFMTLIRNEFCGIRNNGSTVLDNSNPATWTVQGVGGGTASANLQSAFSSPTTVITYGADSGGRNFNHNFGATVAILDYVVTDLQATSTSTADPNLIQWSVLSSTGGSFSAGSFTQAEIDNSDITFSVNPGLVTGDIIAYNLQVTDPSGAVASCSFSLIV